MEAQQNPPILDQHAALVEYHYGLRRETKDAWHDLRAWQNELGAPIETTDEDLAGRWGCCASAAYRKVHRLQSKGLLSLVRLERGYRIEVLMPDPAAAASRRLHRFKVVGQYDPQQSLNFDEAAGTPSDASRATSSTCSCGAQRQALAVARAGPPGEAEGETPPNPNSSKEKNLLAQIPKKPTKQPTNQGRRLASKPDDAPLGLWQALVRGDLTVEDSVKMFGRDQVVGAIADHCQCVVNDKESDRYLFEQAAKLVVDSGVYIRKLHQALESIVNSRKAGSIGPGKIVKGRPSSAGRVFNRKCQEMAKEAGVTLFPQYRRRNTT